jgi:hypothetical protein
MEAFRKEKEMIIHKWISSDGSELVPITDVKMNLTLPNSYWVIVKHSDSAISQVESQKE